MDILGGGLVGRPAQEIGKLFDVAAPRPEGFTMSLRANVEVRLDVAEIIRWILIGYYLLT
jgi:hypothetical protein